MLGGKKKKSWAFGETSFLEGRSRVSRLATLCLVVPCYSGWNRGVKGRPSAF